MSTPSHRDAIWIVRSPHGERVCTRAGDHFKPASTPWIRDHLALLLLFAANDFRSRYRAQALGVVWSLLQPLVMMGILSQVFKGVFPDVPNYPVYVLIALLVWQWFAAALTAATTAFVLQADMVKRTVFPRALLPISSVLSYGINALVESMALVALIPIFPGAFHVSWALLVVPVLIGLFILLLSGMAVAIAVLNVIYRDVAYLVTTGLLILYWLTPIIYPPWKVSPRFRGILAWNPIGALITCVRDVILEAHAPSLLEWLQIGVPTLIVVVAGWMVYRHYESEMLDHV